jgi:hypothetical protein
MSYSDSIVIVCTIILSLSGIGATIFFAIRAQQNENNRMFKDLFTEFNLRYERINDHLQRITEAASKNPELTAKDLSTEDRSMLEDWFNLCAEEYFWHRRGLIGKKIWKSWQSGMNYWYSYPIIKDAWQTEIASRNGKASFYLEKNEDFFKDKKK